MEIRKKGRIARATGIAALSTWSYTPIPSTLTVVAENQSQLSSTVRIGMVRIPIRTRLQTISQEFTRQVSVISPLRILMQSVIFRVYVVFCNFVDHWMHILLFTSIPHAIKCLSTFRDLCARKTLIFPRDMVWFDNHQNPSVNSSDSLLNFSNSFDSSSWLAARRSHVEILNFACGDSDRSTRLFTCLHFAECDYPRLLLSLLHLQSKRLRPRNALAQWRKYFRFHIFIVMHEIHFSCPLSTSLVCKGDVSPGPKPGFQTASRANVWNTPGDKDGCRSWSAAAWAFRCFLVGIPQLKLCRAIGTILIWDSVWPLVKFTKKKESTDITHCKFHNDWDHVEPSMKMMLLLLSRNNDSHREKLYSINDEMKSLYQTQLYSDLTFQN